MRGLLGHLGSARGGKRIGPRDSRMQVGFPGFAIDGPRAFLRAFLSGLFGLLIVFVATAAPSLAHIKSLALVVTFDGSGTAFHLGRGCWITANHVVERVRATRLFLHTGQSIAAVVVERNAPRDVALLRGDGPVPALRLSHEMPKAGEVLWALGFPGDARQYGQVIPVEGRVHPNTGTDGLVWISGTAFHGHSGSPVIGRDGTVVGMLVAVHRFWLDISLAVPSTVIRELVRRC